MPHPKGGALSRRRAVRSASERNLEDPHPGCGRPAFRCRRAPAPDRATRARTGRHDGRARPPARSAGSVPRLGRRTGPQRRAGPTAPRAAGAARRVELPQRLRVGRARGVRPRDRSHRRRDRRGRATVGRSGTPGRRSSVPSSGAADELHTDTVIADDTWRVLADSLEPPALVELLFVVGQYTMLSMVANSAGIEPPPGSDPVPWSDRA